MLQSADDHFVSWGKTGSNQAQAVRHASSYDIFALRHITWADHVHILLVLIGKNRSVIHQKRLHGAGAFKLNARIEAWSEKVIRIGEHDAGANCSSRWSDLVVEKINPADMGKAGLIRQRDTHGVRRTHSASAMNSLLKAQITLLIAIEVHIDRVL